MNEFLQVQERSPVVRKVSNIDGSSPVPQNVDGNERKIFGRASVSPGGLSDQFWPTGRASKPLLAYLKCLRSTSGPLGGAPVQFWPNGRASRPLSAYWKSLQATLSQPEVPTNYFQSTGNAPKSLRAHRKLTIWAATVRDVPPLHVMCRYFTGYCRGSFSVAVAASAFLRQLQHCLGSLKVDAATSTLTR